MKAMNLLALETATSRCIVALRTVDGDWFFDVEAGNTHSQLLLPAVQNLLQMAEISFADLEAIAFGEGPGSFTGVRIACACAQGLGLAYSIPLVPVSTLRCFATTCGADLPQIDADAEIQKIWIANDARMNEVYCAGFTRTTSGVYSEIIPARVCAPADGRPPDASWHCAGDGFAAYEALKQSAAQVPGETRTTALSAAGVLAAAAEAWVNGTRVAARDAQPVYVRDRVALTERERAEAKALARV